MSGTASIEDTACAGDNIGKKVDYLCYLLCWIDGMLPLCHLQIVCQRLAAVQRLSLRCDATSPGWFLEEVWVRCNADGAWLQFPCHTWLTGADG